MAQAGILIARPGIGFPAPVHLERCGSPARLAVTDVDGSAVAAGSLGGFTFGMVVDNTGDVDDGNYAIGQLTLREAINITNTPNLNSPCTILTGRTVRKCNFGLGNFGQITSSQGARNIQFGLKYNF